MDTHRMVGKKLYALDIFLAPCEATERRKLLFIIGDARNNDVADTRWLSDSFKIIKEFENTLVILPRQLSVLLGKHMLYIKHYKICVFHKLIIRLLLAEEYARRIKAGVDALLLGKTE